MTEAMLALRPQQESCEGPGDSHVSRFLKHGHYLWHLIPATLSLAIVPTPGPTLETAPIRRYSHSYTTVIMQIYGTNFIAANPWWGHYIRVKICWKTMLRYSHSYTTVIMQIYGTNFIAANPWWGHYIRVKICWKTMLRKPEKSDHSTNNY